MKEQSACQVAQIPTGLAQDPWKRPKLGRSASPITRRAALTPRRSTRTSTRCQTGAVKQSQKGASQVASRDGTRTVPGETAAAGGGDRACIESVESNDARVARRAVTQLIRDDAPSPGRL